jgi:hypothetical protein
MATGKLHADVPVLALTDQQAAEILEMEGLAGARRLWPRERRSLAATLGLSEQEVDTLRFGSTERATTFMRST